MNWGFSLPLACISMLIGIRLLSWCSVGITSWRQGILSAFHFSFLLHGHPFVARISYSCQHGVLSFFLSDAGFRIVIVWYKGALSSLSCLRYISSMLFRLGVLLFILLSPWLLSHFSIAKLRQVDYRKYRWHYLRHKKIGNLPHFLAKMGIPIFLLEIICLCSFLAHFWIAL